MVAMRDIVRGALFRALPAAAAGVAALGGILLYEGSQVSVESLLIGFVQIGLPSVFGGAAALAMLRPWLRDDAGVDGRRAALLGVASIGLIMTVGPFVAPGRLGSVLWSAACGAAIAIALFFPWLQRRGGALITSGADLDLLQSPALVEQQPAGTPASTPRAAR